MNIIDKWLQEYGDPKICKSVDTQLKKLNKTSMEIKEYQEKSIRTLATLETSLQDDLHMVLGMQTEVAEIADAYKKHMAYGKTLDLVNVKEELGDAMWYIANLCNLHGWDLRDIMATNIDKLAARYPEKFDADLAQNRDLIKERDILEKGK